MSQYDPFREYLDGEVAHVAADEHGEASGVAVGVMLDPETLVPCLVFSFFDDAQKHVQSVLLRGDHPSLPQLVSDAQAHRAKITSEMALKLLAGFAERVASGPIHEDQLAMVMARGKVHCPGCGRRLYGEIARRGGCMTCYPELPPGGTPI